MTFNETEIKAIEMMLPRMGEYVAQAGIMEKPFRDCSKDEILGLFATTIKTFRDEFATQLGDDVPF